MLTDQLQQLQTAKAHVAELEQKVAAERKQALAALPAQYGYKTMQDLIAELQALGGSRTKYTRLNDESRTSIRRMLEAGKTGEEIASATGISRATIQNVKAQLGLVKKRAKPGRQAAVK